VRGQQFKLTNTVRNVNLDQNGMVANHGGTRQSRRTSSMLAAANPQEQKQMLGERLFPLIQVNSSIPSLSFTFVLL